VTEEYLEFPEVVAKVIRRLRIYNDPPSREVHLEFTDGTALSIEIESVRQYTGNTTDRRLESWRSFMNDMIRLLQIT